jgi:DNA-binding NarL/FixJ family response regulator
MDQIVDSARKGQHLERIVGALADGLFVVNAKGEVLCVLQDVTTQRRSNSGLIAAIEAVIADTSAIGRSVVEKFTALRRDREGTSRSLDELTEREREVLGLICQGQDDRGMSGALGLSRNTVRNHIAALYRKIGVNRRSAAIIWARERGITSDEALKPRLRKRLQHDSARH